MNELKPCAHCGGTAVLDYRNGGLYHFVKCESCHVRTDIYANKETPAAIWNTRPNPRPPDDGAVEALEKIVAMQPCTDGGSCFVPMHDGDGNYIGEQNLDPLSVIQQMADVAHEALAALKAKGGGA